MSYCRVKMPVAGLANRLFPWARCKLFSLQHRVRMLAPNWLQLKIGPTLRGESDPRLYGGQFRPAPGELWGLRKYAIIGACQSVKEPGDSDQTLFENGTVVVFEGMKKYFDPLNEHVTLLRAELVKSVRPVWLEKVAALQLPPVGLHVRLGDFAVPKSADELRTRGGVRTPMSWYVDSLRVIRRLSGGITPAFVVSDGGQSELAELLAMPEVTLLRSGSAVGDLLALSKSKLIIATGGSSFSAWASFLGESPVVSVPGQSLAWFNLRRSGGPFVGEFDPDRPSPPALRAIADAITPFEAHQVKGETLWGG